MLSITDSPLPLIHSHLILEQFEPARERDAPVGDHAHQVEADVVVGLAAGGDAQSVRDDAPELVRPLLVSRPRACGGGYQGKGWGRGQHRLVS